MARKMVWIEPTIEKYINDCIIVDTSKKNKLTKEVIVEQILKTVRLFTVLETGKPPLTDLVYNYRLIEALPQEVVKAKKGKRLKWLIDLPLSNLSLSPMGMKYLEEYNERVYENKGLESVFVDKMLKNKGYIEKIKESINNRILGISQTTSIKSVSTSSTPSSPCSSVAAIPAELQPHIEVSGEIEIKGLKELLSNKEYESNKEVENREKSDFQGTKDIKELREMSDTSLKEIRNIVANLKDNLNSIIPMTEDGMKHPLYDTLTRVYGLYFLEKNETNLYKKIDILENGIEDAYSIIDLLMVLNSHYKKSKN
ncbi:MAG: hypothetical protein IJE45_01465 [Bacilli bacterium]|nr:hypothetical protein [Bacilli bacterium]